MPSWSIHLALSKKVCDKLNLNKDLFLYGNLIPDIDCNGKINMTRMHSHYYESNLYFDFCNKARRIDIDKFLLDYKSSIKNHMILGYYSHLLTDNFYNEIAYSKWVVDNDKNPIGIRLKDNSICYVDIEDKDRIKQKYKHDDFELYGKYLYKNNLVDIPKNKKIIKENIKYIKNIFLSDKDIDYRINYLNNGFNDFNKINKNESFKLFYKKELDDMFDSCLEMLIDKIKEVL